MKQKLCTVIGARPQFIKSAPFSIAANAKFDEYLIHTGQHFDTAMSAIFFEQLGLLKPHANLEISGGNHGSQTGRMLIKLEEEILKLKPDIIVVFGDTNSTLAAALVGAKLHIPVAHIEAGLRSFNRRMPEEINRIISDGISRWLFVPSEAAEVNLKKEGVTSGIYRVGDIMYDSFLLFSNKAKDLAAPISEYGLKAGEYYLATLHRQENTDDLNRLEEIYKALGKLDKVVFLPMHPRTLKKLREFGLEKPQNVKIHEPVGYLEMLNLLKSADLILTDSGGLQKEAYFSHKACITLRDETEWIELVQLGWNKVVGTNEGRIISAVSEFASSRRPDWTPVYGEGKASQMIVDVLAACSTI